MKASDDAISNSITNQRFSKIEKRNSEQSSSATASGSITSGLLAAKLKCDEWGIEPQRVKKTNTSQGIGFSSRLYDSPKTLRNKKMHPSNKPHQAQTLQRSRSMKERRHALDNLRKYRSCSSSLFRIDEIDDENNEKGIC
ncbi:hypothetical protein Ocin01_14121 [Orchesella cincta]|uniref:Uncharacterized protein n=1 Tax=Orchesella cincta TaxID=48709 RepID=A0A1D2MHU8_ORCCI|nr:hypothetical protein Ocin01_14121 [Orchesella cincta]